MAKAILFLLLSFITLLFVSIADPALGDMQDSTNRQILCVKACGPIAAYIAVKYVGGSGSINALTKKSGWTYQNGVQLQGIVDAVNSIPNVRCQAIQVPPSELRDILAASDCVAILPVQSGNTSGIDHVIDVVGNPTTKTMSIIDYPSVLEDITTIPAAYGWEGQILLVQANPRAEVWDVVSSIFYGLPIGLLTGGVYLAFMRKRRLVTIRDREPEVINESEGS